MKRRIYDVIIGEVIMAVAIMFTYIGYEGLSCIDIEDVVESLLIVMMWLACAMGVGLPVFAGVNTLIDTFKKPAVENEEEVIKEAEAN